MKKVIILILVISQGIVGFSQDSTKVKAREKVKNYLATSVFPVIKQQQENYINQISDTDKVELEKIKDEFDEMKNRHKGKRNKKKGRSNKSPKQRNNLKASIDSITNTYPKLNDSYKEFIETNKGQWISDIQKIHTENDIEPRKNKDGNSGFEMLFDKMSNPHWLLLWDDSKPISRRNHKKPHPKKCSRS